MLVPLQVVSLFKLARDDGIQDCSLLLPYHFCGPDEFRLRTIYAAGERQLHSIVGGCGSIDMGDSSRHLLH